FSIGKSAARRLRAENGKNRTYFCVRNYLTTAKRLQARGLDATRAWKSASNGRGPWWNAGASHMNAAYPKRFFDVQGLVSLLDTQRRFQHV
ncbi:hypothetical protein AAKU55_004250, partial [Oxalobacteraceae bacterium GrIS 1.11]